MLYPMNVMLKNRMVAVIGGGKVAERKVSKLLEAQANVVIISPSLTEPLKKLSLVGRCKWIEKEFEPKDIAEATLVFAATNKKEVNQAVKQAVHSNQWINIADDPLGSTFHIPAVHREGSLLVTVSTSGHSPALAKRVIQQLRAQFGPNYMEYLTFLEKWRKKIKSDISSEPLRKALFDYLSSEEVFVSNDWETLAAEAFTKIVGEKK